MSESPVPVSIQQSVWLHRVKATPYHGLMIFLAQILLLVLVPLFDDGEQATPLPLALTATVLALVTLVMLGYRGLSLMLGVIGAIAFLWALRFGEASMQSRAPAIAALVATYCAAVYLSLDYAFTVDMRVSQRILCGAAGFVMLGFIFTAAHGIVAKFELGTYLLTTEFEGDRLPRWADFLWFSFSTLTTAGISDMTPVGSWPCAVATLEGLCGILYPATLIARITAMPASGESEKCCW